MPIELKVEKPLEVEEGKHNAEISKVMERKDPYHYIDIYFKLSNEIEIKGGYPASITENSKLGKLLKSLGVMLQVDTMIDLEKTLVGKKVSLMTINKKTDKGTFAEIIADSVRAV